MPTSNQLPSTQEDLASVMDRFQTWNASRQKGPDAKPGDKELSLAEFLVRRAEQTTEYGYRPSTDTSPLKASVFSQVVKAPAPPTGQSPAAVPPAPSSAKRAPTSRAEKTAQPEKQSRTKRPNKGAFPGTESMNPALAASFKSALESSIKENTPSAQRQARESTPKRTGGTGSLPKSRAARFESPSASEGRSSSLNLRLSSIEQLQIKAGAEEAGLPVSAYVRQCVLEVNTLRERLTLAIAELKQASAAHSALPVRVLAPTVLPRHGVLSRIKNLWSARTGLTT